MIKTTFDSLELGGFRSNFEGNTLMKISNGKRESRRSGRVVSSHGHIVRSRIKDVRKKKTLPWEVSFLI